jgi:RNA polymerase sigma-70 factor (ECF subfamily)
MDDPAVQTVQLRQWLERMRAGDLDARDEMLRALCGRLECLARKMLRRFPQVQRWAQTDDVLQNALMRLLHSLQKVQPGSVTDFFGLAALEMRRELLDLARHSYGPLGHGAHDASQGAASGQILGDHDPAMPEDQEDLERW